MTEKFEDSECLLRAVYPENQKPDFWKDGRLSSAAFKDKKGLSVSRTGDRSLNDSVESVRKKFSGFIVSVTVEQCKEINVFLKHCPLPDDDYHSEIHNSPDIPLLDKKKAKLLSRIAKIEYSPA